MPDKISGENIAYTVSASGSNITITWDGGSAEYTGKLEVGKLTIDWTASTNFYKFAPPTAQFVDPNVIWNLNSVGTLLNGVTYDVAFECYPSQYTLDLVADLKNGYVEYNNLDENIKKYLKNEDGDYVLATNTSASLTYTDTRTENGEQTAPYTNPKPQKTTATKSVTVSKDWNNILDDRTKPESLTMNVTRDGVDRYELVLNDSNHWQKSSFISFGIMTIHNGEIVMKTTGHDYSFSEPNAFGYYWELDVPTLRPMLINSVETMLVKVDESEAPSMEGANATAVGNDGYNYYKLTIDGTAYYYKVDEAIASLRAVNNRRSYLNLTKVVDETNAPSDALFTYNIQIKDSNGEDVWFAAQTVEDAAANNETYQLLTVSENVTPEFRTVSGATYNSETNTYRYTYDGKTYILPAADDGTGGYMYTGYYSVDSDQAFTIQMPAGWNVRFINLPTGTTYSITEGAMPEESFSLESITGNRHYKDNEGTVKDEVVGKVSGSTISGSIEYSNSDYKIDVQLKKVDENTKLLSGSEFSLIAMKLNDGNLVEKGNIIGTFTPGTNDVANPADLGGLGIGYYRLTETKSPAGYNILTKYVYLEVYKDADDGTLKARLTNEIGTPIDSMDEATITSSGSESLSYTITVKNYPGVALPSTGSSRTLLYTVFGLTMLLTVGAVLTVRTRKEN